MADIIKALISMILVAAMVISFVLVAPRAIESLQPTYTPLASEAIDK